MQDTSILLQSIPSFPSIISYSFLFFSQQENPILLQSFPLHNVELFLPNYHPPGTKLFSWYKKPAVSASPPSYHKFLFPFARNVRALFH